ncbi:11992_t:CDS:2, partial [Cetraspora pellucida]
QVENSACADVLKIDVLQAVHFIIQGWEEVTAETICNCWCHTNILSVDTNAELYSLSDNIHQTIDLVLEDITNALKDLHIHFANPMSVEEFLSIPEEDVVYEVPKNDQVIEELVKTFKPINLASDDLEEEDSVEILLISISTAIASLETVFMFLLQQDETNEYIKAANLII